MIRPSLSVFNPYPKSESPSGQMSIEESYSMYLHVQSDIFWNDTTRYGMYLFFSF